MQQRPFTFTLTLPLALAASILAAALISRAGPLDPPAGPVTPSYKTLSDVEPRTAINAANTPGDASSTFIITKAGSYYLTQNLQLVSGKAGISTSTSDVTIDLNGFTIVGAPGANQAIVGFGGVGRITIRNGRLQNLSAPAPAIAVGADAVIEDLSTTATSNTFDILSVGDRATIRRCQIQGGSAAITCGATSTIDQVTAVGVIVGVSASGKLDVSVRNSRFFGASTSSGSGVVGGDRLTLRGVQTDKFVIGVQAGNQCIIQETSLSNCVIGISTAASATLIDTTVTSASSSGITVGDFSRLHGVKLSSALGGGIAVGSDCSLIDVNVTASAGGFSGQSRNTLKDCSASKSVGAAGFAFLDSNSFTNCRSDENGGDGFSARFGNIWNNCSARGNTGDGIESAVGGTIRQCRLDSNGSGASVGANIRLTGDACRVEDNSLIGADFGIQTTTGGSTIHRNSSRNSANNFGGISGGNDVGPIGVAATATSPWANIAY